MGPTRMRLDKPVIVAIEDFAVAGGLELTLWADLRVAAFDAKFGVLCFAVALACHLLIWERFASRASLGNPKSLI